VPRLIGYTEAARQTKGASSSRPRRRWTEAELLEAIREKNQPEVAARMIGLYEWMKAQGARASGGTGATTPSVSLWLGEDIDPDRSNPVSVQIFPDSVGIPFGYLIDKRLDAELARLAALVRELPGVAPYIEDLEARNYRHWRGMRPDEVLGSDEALDGWKRVLVEATRTA
jgi:hypothetical protein